MKELLTVLKNFPKKHIAVIGDIMLDKYIFGKVERISPEAPIPIVFVTKESYVPGGAANVANNIASIGGHAHLLGIVGKDNAKYHLLKELKERHIDVSGIIEYGKKPTIQKIRILGQNQQLLRIDYESESQIEDSALNSIIASLKKIKKIDAIIISDYAKGTITKKGIELIKVFARKNNIYLVIDPRPKNKLFYHNVDIITPNHKEACEMLGIEVKNGQEINVIGRKLVKKFNTNVLITRGEKGASLFEKNGRTTHIPTVAKEVYDVSGAGDTFVATLALAYVSGASLKEAAILANYASGIVVAKIGTATATIDELKKKLEDDGSS